MRRWTVGAVPGPMETYSSQAETCQGPHDPAPLAWSNLPSQLATSTGDTPWGFIPLATGQFQQPARQPEHLVPGASACLPGFLPAPAPAAPVLQVGVGPRIQQHLRQVQHRVVGCVRAQQRALAWEREHNERIGMPGWVSLGAAQADLSRRHTGTSRKKGVAAGPTRRTRHS